MKKSLLLTALLTSALFAEVEYPYSGYSKLSSSNGDDKIENYGHSGTTTITKISQGVSLNDYTLFLELGYKDSSNQLRTWDNVFNPGIGVKKSFRDLVPTDWSKLTVSATYYQKDYFSNKPSDYYQKIAGKLVFGGELDNSSLILPYSFYGELGTKFNDSLVQDFGKYGIVLRSNLQQGVVLPYNFILYGDITLNKSSNSIRHWDNLIAPGFGLKKEFKNKLPFDWSKIEVGIQASKKYYFGSYEDDINSNLYLKINFGGLKW